MGTALATIPKIDQKKDAKIKRIVSKKLKHAEKEHDFPPVTYVLQSFWCLILAFVSIFVGAFTFFPAGMEGAFRAALKTYQDGMK